MNFLKKSLNTVSNAFEINSLKEERNDINNQIKKLNEQIKKYERSFELKQMLQQNITSNDQSIGLIRTYFINETINLDGIDNFEQFSAKYNDKTIQQMYKTFNSLQINNKSIKLMIQEIDALIAVDKTIYQNKINDLETKLLSINDKLNKVREKQFGKNK